MSQRILFARADAAFRLGVSLRMVDELIAAKEIHAVKVGRRTLIHAGELEKFARRGTLVKPRRGGRDAQ
jgi:excisionase family DNA binding protein